MQAKSVTEFPFFIIDSKQALWLPVYKEKETQGNILIHWRSYGKQRCNLDAAWIMMQDLLLTAQLESRALCC